MSLWLSKELACLYAQLHRSQTYGFSSDSMSSAAVAAAATEARDSKDRLEPDSAAEERLVVERAAEDEGS